MLGWRERILAPFVPDLARLWLAADPDGLLLEEGVVEALRGRGFELLAFDDHPAFRFAYESGYRARRDCGERVSGAVVARLTTDDFRAIPYDLLAAGRQVRVGLGELFPMFDIGVLLALDRSCLDDLERAVARRGPPGPLGENATKDFALLHVFHVDPDQVGSVADLLRLLLMLHTTKTTLPETLATRFVERVSRQGAFRDWPLGRLVLDRDLFLCFLQERWPRFVEHWMAEVAPARPGASHRLGESPGTYEVPGPADLPLGDDRVRPYVDTLFLEGLLAPVESPIPEMAGRKEVAESWVAVGVRYNAAAERQRRLERLVDALERTVPAADARHLEWLSFARTWAELLVLQYAVEVPRVDDLMGRLDVLRGRVDAAFVDWVLRRYAALYTQLGADPTMLHHVPRALARRIEMDPDAKVVLLVLDGLALDQWLVLRDALVEQRPKLTFHENAVFAWLPTITPVSRQALFAGKPPMQFPTSIGSTSREEALWRQYWQNAGLVATEVGYRKGLGGPGTLAEVDFLMAQPRLRVAGLVVDTVDEIVHGTPIGTVGVHSQVRQWVAQNFLADLLDRFLDAGYGIFLTADHGNVEATGCGNPAEAALAVSRGERARIYANPVLREQVKRRFPEAIEWSPVGLPGDYLPLLAPDRKAFITAGERRVSHGGITVEELIVPFVRIEASAL